MTRSCALSAQVEILSSYHQTLHRLHGEQVGVGSPWGVAKAGGLRP